VDFIYITDETIKIVYLSVHSPEKYQLYFYIMAYESSFVAHSDHFEVVLNFEVISALLFDFRDLLKVDYRYQSFWSD